MEIEKLRQIGLTESEIKVYEALLEFGETTKTTLAKRSRVAPSNIYDVTNRLINKGIISKVKKDGVAHFSPANPNRILDFLNQKQEEMQKEREIVNSILPSLLLKFTQTKEKTNVEVFAGWNGLKVVFEDLLEECKKGDKNYVFGASRGEIEKKADQFFVKYSKLREQKGIITDIIFNKELKKRKERIHSFITSNKYNVRFLPEVTPAEIMLYKNTTCIIILTKEPLVIRITSQEVTESFKQHFEILWKQAKK